MPQQGHLPPMATTDGAHRPSTEAYPLPGVTLNLFAASVVNREVTILVAAEEQNNGRRKSFKEDKPEGVLAFIKLRCHRQGFGWVNSRVRTTVQQQDVSRLVKLLRPADGRPSG